MRVSRGGGEGAEGEGKREALAGSMPSAGPNVGLSLNPEMMT